MLRFIAGRYRRIFVLTDSITEQHCLPILQPLLSALPDQNLHYHSVPAGEDSKSIHQVVAIWEMLARAKFERGDLFLNLGGGVVTDLGGYAASCYKRGIAFGHIPTSLLGMADAAIGGKTGINLGGAKNIVGTFAQPRVIAVHYDFLKTLPDRHLLAGYSEVLKHFLIHDAAAWWQAASTKMLPTNWQPVVDAAIQTKLHFTQLDPSEKNIRKALNFGHTIGHALESHCMATRPPGRLLHGEAVAAGMACEAWLSLQIGSISAAEFESIRQTLVALFGFVEFEPAEVAPIAQWCWQDKKNDHDQIKACLLDGIGRFLIDHPLTIAHIEASLNAYRHGFS